jgi:hypothetical protein
MYEFIGRILFLLGTVGAGEIFSFLQNLIVRIVILYRFRPRHCKYQLKSQQHTHQTHDYDHSWGL